MTVLQLESDAAAALGRHRGRAGWEICEDGDGLWLRCPAGDVEATAALPCLGRYRLDAAGERLIPVGGTLPVAAAPTGPWVLLADWLPLEPPSSLLPGRVAGRLGVSLWRSGGEQPAAAVLTDLRTLTSWAESASRGRMGVLKFAASGGGRVLVCGSPLPAVSGRPFYCQGALLLRCGWEFAPPLRADWVERSLSLPRDATALVHEDARVEVICQEGFAPLTLAALRITLDALTNSPSGNRLPDTNVS